MNILALLPYEGILWDTVSPLLTEKEVERLQGKNDTYRVESALSRLLLFSLVRDLFGERTHAEVVYEDGGKPTLRFSYDACHCLSENREADPFLYAEGEGEQMENSPQTNTLLLPKNLTVSLSHTEGGCAVLLSDEGACGVDTENLLCVTQMKKESIKRIYEKMHLPDFIPQNTEKTLKLTTIIYKIDKNNGKITRTKDKMAKNTDAVFNEKSDDVDTEVFDFTVAYTRMEATGKMTGKGVAFLPDRHTLPPYKVTTLRYENLIVSCVVE